MFLLLLTGCGLKDDLYLPDSTPEPSNPAATDTDDGDDDAEDA